MAAHKDLASTDRLLRIPVYIRALTLVQPGTQRAPGSLGAPVGMVIAPLLPGNYPRALVLGMGTWFEAWPAQGYARVQQRHKGGMLSPLCHSYAE